MSAPSLVVVDGVGLVEIDHADALHSECNKATDPLKINFCTYIMGTTLKPEDLEFIRWLDSKEAEEFWDRTENGEKQILREGWGKAEIEYNRIKGLKEYSENDLKLCEPT